MGSNSALGLKSTGETSEKFLNGGISDSEAVISGLKNIQKFLFYFLYEHSSGIVSKCIYFCIFSLRRTSWYNPSNKILISRMIQKSNKKCGNIVYEESRFDHDRENIEAMNRR